MAQITKPQRIRDPLHNLIEFENDEFDRVMWQVIQTRPFQRLRRIKQLGFSELVYPGATHTRFAHSIGVFHTARRLLEVIKRHLGSGISGHQVQVALAAALVHDLGHGMFSHAFEDVGKRLNLKMAHHETVSDELIRSDELKKVFIPLGKGFSEEVADVIKRRGPQSLYDALVSSQFDADRLDYMQRDRLMAGVQNSGIDFTWLLANLEVGEIPTGVDDDEVGTLATFVLGPKATHAAETFVLSLFQLYPNVYFHKTTRGAEKLFSELMVNVIQLAREGAWQHTGLPETHPIIRFALAPEELSSALDLDDTVFWGALPMLASASDERVSQPAVRLRDRKLLKCVDVRERLLAKLPIVDSEDPRNSARRLRAC